MAQGSNKSNSSTGNGGGAAGTLPERLDKKSMAESDELEDRDGDRADDEAGAPQDHTRPRGPVHPLEGPKRKAAGGFFDIYKPSQGGKVRWGTAAGAALLLLWFASFLYEKLGVLEPGPTQRVLQYGLPMALLVGVGLWVYVLLARSPRIIDFFIGTEGEMKKVHWSSRREVIGSTKVVIAVLFILGGTLFLVDLGLMVFFTEIGVLRVGKNLLQVMFGKTG